VILKSSDFKNDILKIVFIETAIPNRSKKKKKKKSLGSKRKEQTQACINK
jgi:hypothetical protein